MEEGPNQTQMWVEGEPHRKEHKKEATTFVGPLWELGLSATQEQRKTGAHLRRGLSRPRRALQHRDGHGKQESAR
eukprot:5394833-Heterocapsa_arctica.AAC.1